MRPIGGYFELELWNGEEFHQKAIRLNTGRNALEYILLANAYRKIYIPFYTCDVILEPLEKHNIIFEFYSIDANFEPLFDFTTVKQNEAFLYTNYFGLKDKYIEVLTGVCRNLIIDNAQAFYSKPVEGVSTFYSPRKFFGVPDGAYLYTTNIIDEMLFERDDSFSRFAHLLSRIDKGAEFAYSAFLENEKLLKNKPIRKMSRLTKKLLSSINYRAVANTRIENYNYLNAALQDVNLVKFSVEDGQVPMTYPMLIESDRLRKNLIGEKIFTPQYWPNVLHWAPENSLEYYMAKNMIFLPIDQRYNIYDMDRILRSLISN